MTKVPPRVRTLVAAIALTVAFLLALPGAVAHAASPTLEPTPGKPSSGGPGAAVSYDYTWDYSDCQTSSKESDISHLKIVLAWDDSATTPIGFAPVTTNQATHECQGTVSGTVPANATAGDHFPQAYLEDPGRGDEVVPNSNTGKVFQGQQFTVVLAPTPTPQSTPSPTPTDTPAPTDTPTASTVSPTFTATASPVVAANGGGSGSGPPKALLIGLALVLVIAAAVAGTLVVRRRRAAAAGADPFEFLR
jgi:hypothetical protein